MTIHTVVPKAEESGFGAEVPSIPGCATQGETMEKLCANLLKPSKVSVRSCEDSVQSPKRSGDRAGVVKTRIPNSVALAVSSVRGVRGRNS